MVEITYFRQDHAVTLRGHAGAGKQGQDLVCAAVSALTLTLGANVAGLCADKNAKDPVISLKEGDTEVRCTPKDGMEEVVTLVFDALCQGFIVLQSLYPEHVCFSVNS